MLLVFIIFIISVIASCNIKLSIKIKNGKFSAFLFIYILGKICVLNLNLNNRRKKKDKWLRNKKYILNNIGKINFRVERFKLNVKICTGIPELTAFFTGIIGTFLGVIMSFKNLKINFQNYYFKIQPIYTDKPIIDVKFSCIISLSLVHIICVIYRIVKDWRRENYGRKSSNRRAYGNGYE